MIIQCLFIIYKYNKFVYQILSFHVDMVNLESYDSEGPHTPETDDSAEVSVCGIVMRMLLFCRKLKV